ncbi:MAG: ATP-grasp domain-containing protein [Pseudonocardiaceae bacterium]|nr:ATP-grasp domain-containing protein [Pseudonocardiaceae bacterium]
MPENIFVLGLDEQNLRTLGELPHLADYRFYPLLSIDELQSGDAVPLRELLDKAIAQLESFPGSVDAIVGYWDFPVSSMVPMLCARFGLRSADLEAVVKCEHKYWSRVEQHKVIDEHPRFGLVDLEHNGGLPEHLDFPVWLKPVKSASSELAFKVTDQAELDNATTEIREGIGRLGKPFEFVLEQLDLPHEIAEIGGQACLAEQAVGGVQLTVEGYVFGGRVQAYGVVDSVNYPDSTSFLRYQYPSSLPESVTTRAIELSERVIRQIGLDNSAFNIEFFWDSDTDRINLLEVNPRHSQSHAMLFEYVDGVPNHQCMVRLALGRDPELPRRAGEYGCAAKWFLRRFTDGVVRRIPTDGEIAHAEREVPGATVRVVPAEGKRLSEMVGQDAYSYELADIFIGASDETELIRKYERCVELLPFEFDD